jgi:hypothetical protein
MDFDFDTGTIYQGLATLDVTVNPPLGSGPANVLTLLGSGALTLIKGLTSERPAAAGGTDIEGMFRYNTTITQLEYFDGTTWQQLTSTAGTVSSFQTDLDGLTPQIATTGAVTLSGTLGAPSGGTGSSTAPAAGQFLYSAAGTTYAPTTLGTVAVTTFSAGTTGFTPSSATSGDIVLAGLLGLSNGGTNANLTGIAGAPIYSTATAFAVGTAGTSGQAYISGGTGAPTWQTVSSDLDANPGAILSGDGAGAFTATGGTFVGSGTYSGVTLQGTPTNATDAVTKAYADALANGLSWKTSVIAASDADIDLTTGGLLTIDGVTLVAGDRVLVKDQTNDDENGIYIAAAGAWIRSPDMDELTPIDEINGAAAFVEQGTTWADTAWVQTAQVNTLGTDPILWTQFAGPGSYTAGTGLQLIGNEFSLISPVSNANGGTGLDTSSAANGELLIGDGSGFTLNTITGGTGITVTNGSGTITIDVDNTELVTSVTGTANQITATPTVGDVVLTLPSAVILPGSLQVTTSLTVDTLTPNSALYVTTGGEIVSTAALTDGQILIGSTGNPPVPGTIIGGTGVTVTNAPGSITIDIDDTEVVTSFSTGTTGLTPVGPDSGDIVLGGTLVTANGGTGLTTIGAANTILGVDIAGTALEYKAVTAGTGISVVPTAGVLTINNTGVTSVALSDGSTAPIYAISGSPVTTTGTLTFSLNTQTANTVFAGPTTGGAAEPTFRALVLDDLSSALQLYTENAVTPNAPSATGINAVAIGSGSTSTATDGFAVGDGSDARIVGMKAYANGSFATAGDAQMGIYVLRNQTTDNAYTELFLDGVAEMIVLPDNSLFTFDILVAGRRTDATGAGAGYRFVGVAKKDATSGSLTFVGNPSKTVIGESTGFYDARVTQNTTDGAIRVEVRGQTSQDFNWVATVRTTEVTN